MVEKTQISETKKARKGASRRTTGSRTRASVTHIHLNDDSMVFIDVPNENCKIGIYITTVTPELAKKILKSNHENQRNLKPHVVDSYTRTMKAGLWTAGNGETIKFSEKGDLIDGQHRLTSVVKSDTPVPMMIMTGIKEKFLTCIDNGAPRNLGDALKVTGRIRHRVNAHSLAAFIRQFHYQKIIALEGLTESTARKKHRISSIQAIKLYEELKHIDTTLNQFSDLFGTKLIKRIPQSIAILMFYLFSPINREITFSILKTLENGSPFDDKGVSSPAWSICEWITERKLSGVRFETIDYINAFVWAFDNMMNGKEGLKYRGNKNFILGKEHAGCDQIMEIFKKVKN